MSFGMVIGLLALLRPHTSVLGSKLKSCRLIGVTVVACARTTVSAGWCIWYIIRQ